MDANTVANPNDEVEIRLAVLDYVEGWFEGDVERMARCLHPQLRKRTIKRPETGENYFEDVTKEDMVRFTENGGGTDVPRDKIYYKIDILDVYNDIASVKAESYLYIDYLQLVKDEGRWLIMNALYTDNQASGE